MLDNSVDRFPPKIGLTNNIISTLCDYFNIADAWRYYHPGVKEYTWSNNLLSSKSRIDFF